MLKYSFPFRRLLKILNNTGKNFWSAKSPIFFKNILNSINLFGINYYSFCLLSFNYFKLRMDPIIERKEAIHKEEENDYSTATFVQSRWRVLDDRASGVKFILSASPSLMNIANSWPKEIIVEMYIRYASYKVMTEILKMVMVEIWVDIFAFIILLI